MEKYPKYVKRGEYIGVFKYVANDELPIYRFPGGLSVVDEYELKNGSDNKEDLK